MMEEKQIKEELERTLANDARNLSVSKTKKDAVSNINANKIILC
jgi:hypothetical protein